MRQFMNIKKEKKGQMNIMKNTVIYERKKREKKKKKVNNKIKQKVGQKF